MPLRTMKSGCGWASVKYKGKKLDSYKAMWLKKCAQQKEEEPQEKEFKKPDSPVPVKRMIVAHNTIANRNIMHSELGISHNILGNTISNNFYFSDANLLIEAVPFSAINKPQPFLLTISSNALMVADLHCHFI